MWQGDAIRLKTPDSGATSMSFATSIPALHLPSSALDDFFLGIEVLSLDIFDTTLVRRCLRPTDVFAHIEASTASPGFHNDRIDAEREARKRHAHRGSEVSLEEIYDVLSEQGKLPEGGLECELRAEELFLFASPTVKALIEAARLRGIRVIAVSDIYLDGPKLQRLLSACGVEVDKIYSSCDLRFDDIGKYNGTMFRHVLEQEGIVAERLLHVGDNRVSDVQNAFASGVRAMLVSNLHDMAAENSSAVKAVVRAAIGSETATGRMIAGQMGHAVAMDRVDMRTLEGWAYCFGGPLIMGVIRFMTDAARDMGIKRFVLLERDGNILAAALDLIKASGQKFDFDYRLVPSSRRMAVFPLIVDHGFQCIKAMFTDQPKTMSAASFFRVLALEAPETAQSDKALRDAEGHFRIYERHLLNQALQERVALKRMFAGECEAGLEGDSIAWFDVGWALSSAHALNEIIGVKWPCFCVGSYENVAEGMPHFGYLFERGLPLKISTKARGAIEAIELIFSAPVEASAYVFPVKNEDWQVIKVPQRGEAEVRNAYVKAVWAGCLAYVEDVAPRASGMNGSEMRVMLQHQFARLGSDFVSGKHPLLGGVPHSRAAGDNAWMLISPDGSRRKRRPVQDMVARIFLSAITHRLVPLSPRVRARLKRSAQKRASSVRQDADEV